MSFAPPLQPWVSRTLPVVAHLDGTARPQSVRQVDDPWLYELLMLMKKFYADLPSFRDVKTDADPSPSESLRNSAAFATEKDTFDGKIPSPVGLVINTSLNPKGLPIANHIGDMLMLFCGPTGNELDYILLEEKWLFHRSAVHPKLCNSKDAIRSKGRLSPDGLP